MYFIYILFQIYLFLISIIFFDFLSDSSVQFTGFKFFYEFVNQSSINISTPLTTQDWPAFTNVNFTTQFYFNQSNYSSQTTNPPITQTFPPDSFINQTCALSNSLVTSYGYFQSLFNDLITYFLNRYIIKLNFNLGPNYPGVYSNNENCDYVITGNY